MGNVIIYLASLLILGFLSVVFFTGKGTSTLQAVTDTWKPTAERDAGDQQPPRLDFSDWTLGFKIISAQDLESAC